MLEKKIKEYFHKDPDLRVLFYFDPEPESWEEIKQLRPEGIEIIPFEGEWLGTKLKIRNEWKDRKILLYFNRPAPRTEEDYRNFPLLDALVANKELQTGDVATLMDDFQLQPHQMPLVRKYKDELKRTQVQQILRPLLNAASFVESELSRGLLSFFLEFSKPEEWENLIIRLLTWTADSRQKNLKRVQDKLRKYPDLTDELNKHIYDSFAVTITPDAPDHLRALVRRLKYNSIMENLVPHNTDPYKELYIRDIRTRQALATLRENALRHSVLGKAFADVFSEGSKDIRDDKLIEIYGTDATYAYMPASLRWEIISKLNGQDPASATYAAILQKLSLSTQPDDQVIGDVTNYLLAVNAFYTQIEKAGTLVCDSPEEYLQQYTTQYYQVDTWYRRSVEQYRNTDVIDTPVEETLPALKKETDRVYMQFTNRLNTEWLLCMDEKGFDYNNIRVDKQYNFFQRYVAPMQKKVAIIVSDALRYEVAHELLNELHRDEKNVASIAWQLASLPSVTNVGMANLLPGNTLAWTDSHTLTIDGEPCNNLAERNKVLAKHVPNSRAVTFQTVLDGTKQENRELFKADVVYIYHDCIDKVGHKGDERSTFHAARTAINELARMVKLIHGGFNVTKVIVTADHGFLYNDTDIQDKDKYDIEDNEIVEAGARHYITPLHKPVTNGYKIPLYKVSRFQEPFDVVIPYSVNRFRRSGARYTFTHGGGSLEELVVPVIQSSRKDEKVQRKVKPLLVSRNLSVVSNTLKFQLIQENPLSATEKERSLLIGLYNDLTPVSNIVELTLNATGELPTERAYTVTLNLQAKVEKTMLRLKIFDREDQLNPLLEENVKNSTLIQRDF